MSIADNLLSALSERGWSASELEKRSGVSGSTVQNWTRRESPTQPKATDLFLVARALGTTVEELIEGPIGERSTLTAAIRAELARSLVVAARQVDPTLVETLAREFASSAESAPPLPDLTEDGQDKEYPRKYTPEKRAKVRARVAASKSAKGNNPPRKGPKAG